MKRAHFLILGLLLSSSVGFAQPVWSPETRAERETAWMRDSLNVTEAQAVKINRIELTYHQQMDKVGDKNGRSAKTLRRKKDKDMKALLNKKQYQRYYRREEAMREVERKKKVDPNHMTL